MDVTTAEYKDLSGCRAMGLSKSGTLCLIAGRTVMGLVNLDRPETPAQKVPRRVGKHDIGEIQFSLGHETLSAIAVNNKVGFTREYTYVLYRRVYILLCCCCCWGDFLATLIKLDIISAVS
jgi:hypothetical protein